MQENKNEKLIQEKEFDKNGKPIKFMSEEEAEKELPPIRTHTNSNPSMSQLQFLAEKRMMGFFERNFRGFEKGSLRVVVITWIRMTMGIGVMTLPKYFSALGILTGNIMLLFACLLCYLSFRFIFQCSVAKNITQFKDLVAHFLPPWIEKCFKVTLTCDYIIFFIVYSVVSWNLFEYLLYFIGLTKDDWLDDPKTITFKEYHPEVIVLRVCFFTVIYLALIFLLLKKSLESLKYVSIVFLTVMISLIVFITLELPGFYNHYKSNDLLKVEWISKPFDPIWVVKFFSLLLFFYVQPFILSFRSELLTPSFQRLNKTSYLSLMVEYVIYTIFGTACYASLGDNYTPNLMLLRSSYEGKNVYLEWTFRGLIVVFFILNTIGIACFNPTFRSYLENLISFKNENTQFKVLSLVPYFFAVLIATIFPNIIGIFGIIGLVVCNFNGFIIPVLMKIELSKEENASRFKILALRVLATGYVLGGLFGVLILMFGNK